MSGSATDVQNKVSLVLRDNAMSVVNPEQMVDSSGVAEITGVGSTTAKKDPAISAGQDATCPVMVTNPPKESEVTLAGAIQGAMSP